MTVTRLDASDLPWERCALPGCAGARTSAGACLEHLSGEERETALRMLGRGRPLDGRGVRFDGELLTRLLDAVPCDDDGRPLLKARFDGATFAAGTRFDRVVFVKEVSFDRAVFEGEAAFTGARFDGPARFARTTVTGPAAFDGAVFAGQAWFGGTIFDGPASFQRARFATLAWFSRAAFAAGADFGGARFAGDATFDGAEFGGAVRFAEAAFEATVTLVDVAFGGEPDFRDTAFSERAEVPPQALRQAMRTGVAFASWPARAAAAILDLVAPAVVVAAAAGAGMALQRLFRYDGATAWLAAAGLLAAATVLVRALVDQGRTGQTPGKRRAGIRVVRLRDGHPLGPGRSVVRSVLHVVDTVPLLLGWLRPLWHRRRQTFADTLVGSVVVKGRGWNRPGRPEPTGGCC